MSNIQRYFSESAFQILKEDIFKGKKPLIQTIIQSGGELDLQIRPNNKFNVYYKGNSLAEVEIQPANYYNIKIHAKFDPIGSATKDGLKRFPNERFRVNNTGDYFYIKINRNELLKFFQGKIINALSSKIKAVNYSEEITFEQSLITDNLECEDFIIIDRQVGGGGISGFLDLLALKKNKTGRYKFVVLEVKLGNNTELKGKVVGQIEAYMEAIKNNVENFKKCYEINYAQKKELGIFPESFPATIQIDDIVDGRIVVGLYSKIGDEYIKELTSKYPDWKFGKNIVQFKNVLRDIT